MSRKKSADLKDRRPRLSLPVPHWSESARLPFAPEPRRLGGPEKAWEHSHPPDAWGYELLYGKADRQSRFREAPRRSLHNRTFILPPFFGCSQSSHESHPAPASGRTYVLHPLLRCCWQSWCLIFPRNSRLHNSSGQKTAVP